MSAGMEKGLKYCQDQSSIMLLFEHTFGHNAVVLRVTLKKHNAKILEHHVSNPSYQTGLFLGVSQLSGAISAHSSRKSFQFGARYQLLVKNTN